MTDCKMENGSVIKTFKTRDKWKSVMTDYTPDDDITFHRRGLSFKFSEYARLKREHAELVELAKANRATLEEQADRFKHFGKGHEELDQAIKETRELIERIDRE